MLLAAHFAMSSQMPGILQFEIPMGSIAFRLGPIVQTIFLLLIFMEIFSTFVADIYGVSVQLQQRLPVAPALVTPLLMLVCYVFSQFGFSSLLGGVLPDLRRPVPGVGGHADARSHVAAAAAKRSACLWKRR